MLMASRRMLSGRRCSVRSWERSCMREMLRARRDRAKNDGGFSAGDGGDVGGNLIECGGGQQGKCQRLFRLFRYPKIIGNMDVAYAEPKMLHDRFVPGSTTANDQFTIELPSKQHQSAPDVEGCQFSGGGQQIGQRQTASDARACGLKNL